MCEADFMHLSNVDRVLNGMAFSGDSAKMTEIKLSPLGSKLKKINVLQEELEVENINSLSQNATEKLNSMFGVEPSLPLEHIEHVELTPEASLAKASEYVAKMEKQGLVSAFEQEAFVRQVMRPRFISSLSKSKVQIETESLDMTKLCASEPYMTFWLKSKRVQQTIVEIRTMPFVHQDDADIQAGNYLQMVATVVRTMKHDNMLKTKNSTKKSRQGAMEHFITSVNDARRTIITRSIKHGLLKVDELTESLKKEFEQEISDIVTRPATAETSHENDGVQINYEVENRVLEHMSLATSHLPPIYRFSGIVQSPEAARATQRNRMKYLKQLPSLIETALSRPLSVRSSKEKPVTKISHSMSKSLVKPKATNKDVYKAYMENEDPLKIRSKAGSKAPLEGLEKYARDVIIDHPSFRKEEEEDVFETEVPTSGVAVLQKPIMLAENAWSTSELRLSQAMISTDTEEQQPTLLNAIGPYNASSKVRFQSEPGLPDLAFINSGDSTGMEIFQRLQKIWSELGFTVQQKLQLVLKYTSTVNDSQRLGDSLTFWEMALSTASQYEKEYISAKEFFKFEAGFSKNRVIITEQIAERMFNIEKTILSIASSLKTTFDDTLILDRMNFKELITYRRSKLVKMISDNDIPIPKILKSDVLN